MSREIPIKVPVTVWVEYEPNPWRGYDHEILSIYVGKADVTEQISEAEREAIEKHLQENVPYWEAGN